MREALKLNGTVVLDRHIRVDSIAHPAKQDTQKCVFIGNLDFEAQEDSLWRHFASCGKIESVRIIRDAKTNVGKGFAYVQFEVSIFTDFSLMSQHYLTFICSIGWRIGRGSSITGR